MSSKSTWRLVASDVEADLSFRPAWLGELGVTYQVKVTRTPLAIPPGTLAVTAGGSATRVLVSECDAAAGRRWGIWHEEKAGGTYNAPPGATHYRWGWDDGGAVPATVTETAAGSTKASRTALASTIGWPQGGEWTLWAGQGLGAITATPTAGNVTACWRVEW